jgi:hypothetical protein
MHVVSTKHKLLYLQVRLDAEAVLLLLPLQRQHDTS